MDEATYTKALDLAAAGRREEAAAALRSLLSSSDNLAAQGFAFAALAENLCLLRRPLDARGITSWAYAALNKADASYAYVIYADSQADEALGKRKAALSKLNLIMRKYSWVLELPEHRALWNRVLVAKAVTLALLEKNAQARPLLEIAASRGLDREKVLFYLGVCCFKMHDHETAERHLRQVLTLRLEPGPAARAHYTLAIVCYHRARYAWARQELEWCLENGGEHVEKHRVLKAIMDSSRAMGLDEDLRRFSRLLRNS